MKRIERLTALITFIQSKKYVSTEQIKERFQISTRTTYRDIASLKEIGIPISYEEQRGYFIVEGYFLKPVSFSNEEAIALVLGSRLMQRYSDLQTNQSFRGAITKIKAAMHYRQKEDLEDFEKNVKTYISDKFPPIQSHLHHVQEACRRKEILAIDYVNNKQEFSSREIEPIGLSFYGNNWHVIAYCWLRLAYRDFTIAKVQQLHKTGRPFRKTDHLSLEEYIAQISKL